MEIVSIIIVVLFMIGLYTVCFAMPYTIYRFEKLHTIRMKVIKRSRHLLPYIPDRSKISLFNFWYPDEDKIMRMARQKYRYHKHLNS